MERRDHPANAIESKNYKSFVIPASDYTIR